MVFIESIESYLISGFNNCSSRNQSDKLNRNLWKINDNNHYVFILFFIVHD